MNISMEPPLPSCEQRSNPSSFRSSVRSRTRNTYFSLLLVEIIDDHTDEEIEREERSEDDEQNEVDENVHVVFMFRLTVDLEHGSSETSIEFRDARLLPWHQWHRP